MNRFYKISVAASILLIFLAGFAMGQGNDNPTGVAGQFNGDVLTGCDYDPYTSTARRQVVDMTVAGGVGAYPLQFGRLSTSRYNAGLPTYFGAAGSWLHSYQWSIDNNDAADGIPNNYTVNYANGNRIAFSDANGDGVFNSPVGVKDRLQVVWDDQSHSRVYVVMPDGGKVWFAGLRGPNKINRRWPFTYTLKGIIDPYGQTTTIVTTGSGTSAVTTITEPAGRMLKIFNKAGLAADVVIDRVEEWLSATVQGRTVTYSYSLLNESGTNYSALTNVVYPGGSTTAAYTYQSGNVDPAGRPLLSTCDDPMYAGAMRKIHYTYVSPYVPPYPTAWTGEIQSEDSGTTGQPVSTLSNDPMNGLTETTGDTFTGANRVRHFHYGGWNNLLLTWTDFRGITLSQTQDSEGFNNSFTDANGHTTNWTNDPISGRVTQISFPQTPGDTPPGTPRGTVTYTYGWATCPDPNNRDANNPYYLYSITDEGGHATIFLRDTAKRIAQVNYPDGGTESFTYNSFGEVLTHVMKTGGTETMTYDSRGLLQTYRNPDNASGNPTARYQYDSLDRVTGVADVFASGLSDTYHTMNFSYNSRSQVYVATRPIDPVDGLRHTITNLYNTDGTLQSSTDDVLGASSFTYDEYRRVRTAAVPGHSSSLTGTVYYDANGTGDDYSHTDGFVTHATSPSGKKVTNGRDALLRRTYTIVGDGTSDAAKTSFGYDNIGNVTSVVRPNEQPGQLFAGSSSTATFDERNRPMSVTDELSNSTSITYDAAGHVASVTRPNGQSITCDSFDSMNRLLQSTVHNSTANEVSKQIYYNSGLLHTTQNPLLVASYGTDCYSYDYDSSGRPTTLHYPGGSTEGWTYDAAGRLATFTNRNGKVQTITSYDALNRPSGYSWNDGTTPSVTLHYDNTSRVKDIINANATVTRTYFPDGLLNTETTTLADAAARVVTLGYDSDSNLSSLSSGSVYGPYTFGYTNRNQVSSLTATDFSASFGYDLNGNLTSRSPGNSTSSTLTYDVLDRVTNISHALNGTTRTLAYAYDANGNRKWTKRDGGTGDVFGYDLDDQSVSMLVNIANPDTTSPGSPTITYDRNGNRTAFASDTYVPEELDRYASRNGTSFGYNSNGAMTANVEGSIYTYDAQNRVLTASKGGVTDTFTYDGLGRQVTRKVGASATVYNVYAGWNLIGECASGATSPSVAYLYGPGGVLKNITTNNYYYQDASGSTSHLANSSGALLEWYRSDLQGTPVFYNASNSQISSSAYNVRHLFSGEQWYSEIGLYDLRNRFYSPDLGRFLQTDPAHSGSNLYRYAGNNPTRFSDPFGLIDPTDPKQKPESGVGGYSDTTLYSSDGGQTWGPAGSPGGSGSYANTGTGYGPGYASGGNGNLATGQITGGTGVGSFAGGGPVSGSSMVGGGGLYGGSAGPTAIINGIPGSYRDAVLSGAPLYEVPHSDAYTIWNLITNANPLPDYQTKQPILYGYGPMGPVEEAAILAAETRGAESALNGVRLNQQLSAQSAFNASGGLSQEAINGSQMIFTPGELGNPAIPSGFGKFTTQTFESPSGSFQVHFYQNPTTGEIWTGLDYKTIFNNPIGH